MVVFNFTSKIKHDKKKTNTYDQAIDRYLNC